MRLTTQVEVARLVARHESLGSAAAARAPVLVERSGGRTGSFPCGWRALCRRPLRTAEQARASHTGGSPRVPLKGRSSAAPSCRRAPIPEGLTGVKLPCERNIQATKSQRWMPWRQEPMKDVNDCEKLRGAVYWALIRRCPNGETQHSSWSVTQV